MARSLLQESDEFTVSEADLGVTEADPEVTYRLRALTRGTYKRIVKAHTKRGPTTRTGQPTETVDWVAVTEDLVDYALVGWSGILLEGQPAECVRDVKLQLDPDIAERLVDRAGRSQIVAQEAGKADSFRGAP